MCLKCVVQREEILAVSGLRETLSPLIVRKNGLAVLQRLAGTGLEGQGE